MQNLNGAMTPELQKYLVDYTKTQPLSLTNDETSDTGVKKMNAMCTLIFDVRTSKEVELYFYIMCPITGENVSITESLFHTVDGALKKDELNWSKCARFGVDNCNTNIGCYSTI